MSAVAGAPWESRRRRPRLCDAGLAVVQPTVAAQPETHHDTVCTGEDADRYKGAGGKSARARILPARPLPHHQDRPTDCAAKPG